MPLSIAQGGLNNSSINLEKSRQTSAIMPSGKISEFNDDSASFNGTKFAKSYIFYKKILTKISVNFG